MPEWLKVVPRAMLLMPPASKPTTLRRKYLGIVDSVISDKGKGSFALKRKKQKRERILCIQKNICLSRVSTQVDGSVIES